MATNNFSLRQANGTTVITIAQPLTATWESIARGTFADGTPCVSAYRRVVWTFDRLTATQYQTLVQSRLTGRQTFETWKRPNGATAGAFVVCTGIMAETIPGVLRDGEYNGVTVTWTMVVES
jgi:hypothetical protein